MFNHKTATNGFVSVFYSLSNRPLSMWSKKTRNGHITRTTDNDFHSTVLEISGTKSAHNYITCPPDIRKVLGVEHPVLNLTVKNMQKLFAFDVQIRDDKNVRRRFKISTHTSNTEVKPFSCKLPLVMEDGWNRIVIPLQDFTRRIYGTNYAETLRIQIYANCRLRRIYFSDRYYAEEDLPIEYKVLPERPKPVLLKEIDLIKS